MNEEIYNDIVTMGFPEDQARKAASRFGNGEAAINWILEGMPEGSGGPPENMIQDLDNVPIDVDPPTLPPRPTTPYESRVMTPRSPSPTVSALDGNEGSRRKVVFQSIRRAEKNIQGYYPEGMTEDEALEAAIKASQSSIPSTSYDPPPGPPPTSSPSRRARSPTPAPPDINETRTVPPPGPGTHTNPFYAFMPENQPNDKTAEIVPGSNNPFLNRSHKEVRFDQEAVRPESKDLGKEGEKKNGTLSRVEDDTVDESRGMVLFGKDAAPPKRDVSVWSNSPTGSPPPVMDQYPIDKDEEEEALQKAIKLSMSGPSPENEPTSHSRAEEGKVEDLVQVDVRMADVEKEANDSWKTDEDEEEVYIQREPGMPLLVRTKMENSVFSAHAIQALISVPAVRKAVCHLDLNTLKGSMEDLDILAFMQDLCKKYETSDRDSTWVTLKLDRFGLKHGSVGLGQATYRMMHHVGSAAEHCRISRSKVIEQAKGKDENNLIDLSDVDDAKSSPTKPEDDAMDMTQDDPPEAGIPVEESDQFDSRLTELLKVFTTRAGATRAGAPSDPQIEMFDHCWELQHDPKLDKSVSDCLARFLSLKQPEVAFKEVAEVFCIGMRKADRLPGQVGGEVLVELQETIYFDRFMLENHEQVKSLTEKQNANNTKIQSLQKEIEGLSRYQNHDIEKMIDRAMKHFETDYIPEGSEVAAETIKRATLNQLQEVKEKLAGKKAALSQELEAEQSALRDLWDTPQMKRYKYNLHSVCFNSGWVGLNAIRSYIKGPEGHWWRIQHGVLEKASFQELATDNWGLMFDQGPFLMVYCRDHSTESDGLEPKIIDSVARMDDRSLV